MSDEDVPSAGADGADNPTEDISTKTPTPPSPKEDSKNTPNSAISYANVEGGWKPEWNVFIADALDTIGQTLISAEKASDMKQLCPNYHSAPVESKKAVWALFFASIAKFESGFDPKKVFNEPPPLNNQSVGLLQLSYGDDAHKGCKISKAKQNVTDPQVNLECGVAIMKNQLEKRGTLFTSKHYYWSVLTNKKEQIKAHFNKYVSQIPKGCSS